MSEVIAALIAAAAALFGVALQARKPPVTIEDLTAEKAYLAQATARERELLGPAHESRLFAYTRLEERRATGQLFTAAALATLFSALGTAAVYGLSDPPGYFNDVLRVIITVIATGVTLFGLWAAVQAAVHLTRESSRWRADHAKWRKSSPYSRT